MSTAPVKPLIVPEPFSGVGSWEDWIDHFESAAAVNKWEDADKLLWLRARMTGRAQKSYKNLPDIARATYDACKTALQERFEPASKKDLYLTEFYARKKRKTEDWASFAEDVKTLADRAFSNLEEAAREHLALTRYLEQLDNQQVAFSVKQKRSKSVDEAVTATLEMESYLINSGGPSGGHVGVGALQEEKNEDCVAAVTQSKQDTMMEMMQAMMERLEKLETRERRDQPPASRRFQPRGPRQARAWPSESWSRNTASRQPITCFRCGKEGHVARGCRAPKPEPQEN